MTTVFILQTEIIVNTSMAHSHYKGIEIFEPSTQRTIINEVEKRVEQVLNHEQCELELRRERLRQKFEKENYQRISQPNQTKKFNEMKGKILEAETQKERERLELVKQKRQQQKFANCEKIRTVLSKQQNDAIKRHQLWQINEKLKMSKEKSNDDLYYHQLILDNVKDSMKCEEEEMKLCWKNKMSVRQAYVQQMEYKQQRKQEETREKEKEKLEIELMLEKHRQEETAEQRKRCKRRKELADEMREMMKRETHVREQRRAEEREMRNEIEIIRTQQKELNQTCLKQELDAYLVCLAELTALRKLQEKRFDEKLQELKKEQEKRQSSEKAKLEQARRDLHQSVLQGREKQLREQNEAEKRAKELNVLEQQKMLKQVNEYRNEVEKNKLYEAEKKRKHAEHLKQQIRERELKKALEKEEEIKLYEAAVAGQTRLEHELQDLTLNPPNWDKHPLQGIKSATYFIPQ